MPDFRDDQMLRALLNAPMDVEIGDWAIVHDRDGKQIAAGRVIDIRDGEVELERCKLRGHVPDWAITAKTRFEYF